MESEIGRGFRIANNYETKTMLWPLISETFQRLIGRVDRGYDDEAFRTH